MDLPALVQCPYRERYLLHNWDRSIRSGQIYAPPELRRLLANILPTQLKPVTGTCETLRCIVSGRASTDCGGDDSGYSELSYVGFNSACPLP